MGTQSKIVCIGGSKISYEDEEPQSSIEICDPTQPKWKPARGGISELRDARRKMAAVCVGEKLYVVGGDDGRNILSKLECFDLETGKWSELASLETARWEHSLVAFDERYLYAIGGSAVYRGVSRRSEVYERSVERFDIKRNVWTPIKSISDEFGATGACVYRGQIYVVGNERCERFDPVANKWTPIASMLRKRRNGGVALVGDYMYAIGGWVMGEKKGDDYELLSACERYNFAKNEWTDIKPPLLTALERFGVAVVGHRIFVTGGQSRRKGQRFAKGVKMTEVFDTKTLKWSQSALLNDTRLDHATVCLSSRFIGRY